MQLTMTCISKSKMFKNYVLFEDEICKVQLFFVLLFCNSCASSLSQGAFGFSGQPSALLTLPAVSPGLVPRWPATKCPVSRSYKHPVRCRLLLTHGAKPELLPRPHLYVQPFQLSPLFPYPNVMFQQSLSSCCSLVSGMGVEC